MNSFNEVKIANQIWMDQNLNVDVFRNGDPITEAKTAEAWVKACREGNPAWCYYDNNPANGKKYGKLYNFHAAKDLRGVAPEGWHVPTDNEWLDALSICFTLFSKTFVTFLTKPNAGSTMKSTSGWIKNGTNKSGFTGLPGGMRQPGADFDFIGKFGTFWTQNAYKNIKGNLEPIVYILKGDNDKVTRMNIGYGSGISIRCIKNK